MRSIEWAAGLFEGEGCISLQKRRNTPTGKQFVYMSLHLQMTDEDVVRSFAEAVGIGNVTFSHPPDAQKKSKKPTWVWRVYNKQAMEVGWKLYPHLHRRRMAKWLECVQAVEDSKGGVEL